MPIPDNVERLFRALHDEAVKEYDDTLHQVKAQNARIEKVAKVQEKRRQDLLRSIGANVDQLEKDQRNDEEALKRYLDEVRPSLISRPSVRAQETKEHALRAASLGVEFIRFDGHLDKIQVNDGTAKTQQGIQGASSSVEPS